MVDKKTIWHETLESIKVSVSPAIFGTWFSQTHLAEIGEDKDLKEMYHQAILELMPQETRDSYEKLIIVSDTLTLRFRALIIQRGAQLVEMINEKKCVKDYFCARCWMETVCKIKQTTMK